MMRYEDNDKLSLHIYNKMCILGVDRLITEEKFFEKYNITEELLLSAGITWDELCDIYRDFEESKSEKYQRILDEFVDNYLKDINKSGDDVENTVKVHSYRGRVKQAEHVIEKIVRKKQENQVKYKNLDKTNYEKFITDLIGIRCFVLFKADWKSFHNYIVSKFENNIEYYVKDCILDFDSDIDHYYIAEPPKVHIRNGDAREIYDELLPPDCVIDGKVYRSAHYIIKYQGVYLEIQVRTLFEEGWGEVDHAIVYPYFKNDRILKEYTELLNRLSGLADEMSSFFYRLKEIEKESIQNIPVEGRRAYEVRVTGKAGNVKNADLSSAAGAEHADTPSGCLQSVIDE